MPAITLKEHIWYLFRYECGVQSKNIKIQAHAFWMQAFKTLTEAGKIEHLRVLEEAFLTVSRNLNRAVTGFYFDLIATLEPADEELIRLQEAMLTVFAARHSKPINQVLTYIKRIYRDTRFDVTGFMAYLPQLLTTDIKSTVSATLHLIDALGEGLPGVKTCVDAVCRCHHARLYTDPCTVLDRGPDTDRSYPGIRRHRSDTAL